MSTVPSVLEKIAQAVRTRLEVRKSQISPAEMQQLALEARNPHPFREPFVGPGVHVLSEIKFSSPSQGALAGGSADRAVEIAREYLGAGAAALSILTEQDHFHGSLDYLSAVRLAFPKARLLLKDFVLDEYQLAEARVVGADAALLIVALLGEERTGRLLARCRELGLTALVEVHDERELEIAVRIGAELIGVNNRNLKTLEISLATSERLVQLPRAGATLLCESGLSTARELRKFRDLGFDGFLIGTSFMKTDAPGAALSRLIREAR